ncbi:MAG: hypothetical protein ACOH1K_06955, partial [Rhodoglobus sp.]
SPSTATSTAVRSRTRASIIVLGLSVPIAIAVAGAIVMIQWIPELPDPVASHWSPAGPDSYTPIAIMIAMPVVATVLFSIFAAAMSWRAAPKGGLLRAQKVLIATSMFLATMLTITIAGSLAIQRGVTNANQTGTIGIVLATAFAAAGILALMTWFVLPPSERGTSTRTIAEPISTSATERLYFASTTRIGTPVIILLLAIFGALAIFLIARAIINPTALLLPGTVAILALVLAMGTVSWRVTIDQRGLSVRSSIGWPRIRLAPEQIASVAVVQVDPLGEFGGYGWRWDSEGRSGVVLAKGDAIEVTKLNGKRFVVTVHDAASGAAVLASIRAR